MSLPLSKHTFRTSIIHFIKNIPWSNPFSLTLTLKQQANFKKLDTILASTNIRHFVNRLNRLIFKSSARRFKKSIKLFPVIEKSADDRFHVHAVIDCPNHIEPSQFHRLIDDAWSKTNFGYRHIHIQPIRDDGWASYITKFEQKLDYNLAIDWENVHSS